MLNKFRQHILEERPFDKRERLLLALSGGVDSVVLAHLLKRSGFHFALAHCNFQLRGKASEGDERFIKNLAKKMGIEIFVKRFDTEKFARKEKLSVQMAARKLRYDWFDELMKENKFEKLLTAHHLNDNLETFLLNFTRGTGWKGLKGIPEISGYIVRPLLRFERAEIERYAKENRIRFREDASNYEEKYARNLLRARVIPALKQLNPSLEQTFLNNLRALEPGIEILNEATEERKKKFLVKQNTTWKLDFMKGEKHRNFYLFGILSSFGFNPDQIEIASSMVASQPGKLIESERYQLLRDRDFFVIREKQASDATETEIENFPSSFFGATSVHFTIHESKGFIIPREKNIACFDLDKFKGRTLIRPWREGDRFHPLGMKGTKKLSDFFTGQKMNLFEKEAVRVLESDGKIAWVIGYRADERFRVTESTKRILRAEIIPG